MQPVTKNTYIDHSAKQAKLRRTIWRGRDELMREFIFGQEFIIVEIVLVVIAAMSTTPHLLRGTYFHKPSTPYSIKLLQPALHHFRAALLVRSLQLPFAFSLTPAAQIPVMTGLSVHGSWNRASLSYNP